MKCKQYDECGREEFRNGLCLMHLKRQIRDEQNDLELDYEYEGENDEQATATV